MRAILSLFVILFSASYAHAFEYEQRVSHSLAFKIRTLAPLTKNDRHLLLCTTDPSFRIKRLQLKPASARQFTPTLPSLALTSQGCFLVGNLEFSHTGLWELAIWDKHDDFYTLPLVIADHKHLIYNEIGQSSVQVWVSNSGSNHANEAWLFCGKRKVGQVYLFNKESQTKIYRSHLRDFSKECRIFTDLPLPQKGLWQMITVLDNGEKLFGKVQYH